MLSAVDDFLLDPEMQWEQVKYALMMDASEEVAQRMLSRDFDIETISEISGLNEAIVRELKEKMDQKK